ncbi:hypothetical protein F4677DRAFT_277076 [Hypoxylon crocopeplum]|nr:hypothetical protein F4677DRAFT_277076 [Hypoxylon crocopeplum]
MAVAAEHRMCQKIILDSLWFRTMDDRRHGVELPHSKTPKWALEPRDSQDTDTEWDDLSEWLRARTGIYWVSGKGGSGKPNLMKYIHSHGKTRSLLEEWAGGSPLSVASFFFYYLGSAEQKSQDGLSRALLYYILDNNPSSIQGLLPSMWQEAKLSKADEKVQPPSTAEMTYAFEKLSSGQSGGAEGRKFCFIIDGLDEYSGNYRVGIFFIKNLARSRNIKIIVSSRPIPACVDAFSRDPKLHLHDLTKDDIISYVDAEVGSHPYMEKLTCLGPVNAPKILQDLVDKASGVFLWIILACRSVLEGFAAGDYLSDLQRRIDELPPELEDLFRHMLGKVDLRYQSQCAKLLRICHQNRLVQGVTKIQSIGLAVTEEYKYGPGRAIEPIIIPIRDRRIMCGVLERRLRSRCCGLLELKRPRYDHTGRCFCRKECGYHDVMVDSIVEFMHRTVFDFLNGPGVWELECLQIREDSFEPNSYLADISLRLSLMHPSSILGLRGNMFAREVMLYAIQADKIFAGTSCPIIPILAELGKHFCYTRVKNFSISWFEQYFPHISLYIAAESGMVRVLRAHKSWDSPIPVPVLYHALLRPLSKEIVSPDRIECFQEIIEYILGYGVSPNEYFGERPYWYGERTTPWISWLQCLCELPLDRRSMAATDIEVTILLMNAGADMAAGTLHIAGRHNLTAIRNALKDRSGHDGSIQERDDRIRQLSESIETLPGTHSDFTPERGSPSHKFPAEGVGRKRSLPSADIQNSLEPTKKLRRR